MAHTRMINTRFWIDDYISNLDPIEKLLFLYFLTNPATEICGVYEIPLKNIALDTGIDKEMVIKIINRFKKDKRIIYEKGWLAIVNFAKHQIKNPSVIEGIRRGFQSAPKEIIAKLTQTIDSLSPDSDTLSYLTKLNLTKLNLTDSATPVPFSLKNEIKKLEDSKRRDLNIIALLLEERKTDIQTIEQFNVTLKRHLRAAKDLASFTDEQILKAVKYAKKEYGEIWQLETLIKILTK